jgi:hypothetical protein
VIDIAGARRHVLQFLSHRADCQAHDIEDEVARVASLRRDQVREVVHEVIWDLVVERVLTIKSNDGYNWAFLKLTDFGQEVVREQRWSPYDPDGYLRELANLAPRLANLCEMYIAEALSCFRGGSYLATAVMLGAASEGNVSDLFSRYDEAMAKGRVPERSGYEQKLQKARSFYEKYDVFRRYFDPVRKNLPDRLVGDLDGQMDGVLHLIRSYRNDAGHPTRTKKERMAAFRSLVLFVPYCQRIEELGNWLESNADNLQP